MRRLSIIIAVVVTPGVLFAADGPAWPQFRGPGALGVADTSKPPVKIGLETNVFWKSPVPPGVSSPVIAGNRIFLTGYEGGKLFTMAYDRTTGKEIWRTVAPTQKIEAYHKTEASPASATCATDGTKVVSYFGSCGLFCYDLDGKELWKYELPTAKSNNDFGSGTSPVIADGKVILARDLKDENRLLCINLETGSRVWETKREGFATGWSTPAIWDTPAGKQIALPGYGRMVGYDFATGAEKWTVKGMPAACCTTPIIVEGNLVFAGWSPGEDFKLPPFDEMLKQLDTDGDGKISKKEAEKSAMLKDFFDNNDLNKDGFITKDEWEENAAFMAKARNSAFVLKPGGTGDVTKSHVVWKVTKGLPYVPSPLAYQDRLYTVSMQGRLSAYDLKTGKEIYLDESVGLAGVYASPVAANGYVYICGLDKSVIVIKAGNNPSVAHRAKLDDRIAATPAIVDDTIYIRTGKTLFAFAEKK